ncbi:MAG TPA: hypothetical protein VFV92_12090, partial [Candidatus Bathyarchaeia archaeon]|nr:hypothetical protein [Candidatus Bathyarchaeia archaeon]
MSNKDNISTMYIGQQEQFTAKVTGNSNTAVTWSLTQNGTDCTTNSACGTLSSTTANPVTYTAPSTPPNPAVVSVTATSQADNTQSDSLPMSIVHISVQITPYTGTAA